MGQIPNALSILSKLEDGKSSFANCAHLKMSPGERSLQVSRFYFALNRLVNHPANEDCNKMACFIPYDDTGTRVINLFENSAVNCCQTIILFLAHLFLKKR